MMSARALRSAASSVCSAANTDSYAGLISPGAENISSQARPNGYSSNKSAMGATVGPPCCEGMNTIVSDRHLPCLDVGVAGAGVRSAGRHPAADRLAPGQAAATPLAAVRAVAR